MSPPFSYEDNPETEENKEKKEGKEEEEKKKSTENRKKVDGVQTKKDKWWKYCVVELQYLDVFVQICAAWVNSQDV